MGSFLECRLVVIRAVFGVSFEWQDYCNRHSDPFKASIEIKALVDTGATKSLLDDKIAAKLCLRAKAPIPLKGFDGSRGSEEYPCFDVSAKVLSSGGDILWEDGDFEVAGVPLSHKEYNAVIGMDILDSFTLKFLFDRRISQVTRTKV